MSDHISTLRKTRDDLAEEILEDFDEQELVHNIICQGFLWRSDYKKLKHIIDSGYRYMKQTRAIDFRKACQAVAAKEKELYREAFAQTK